MVEWIGIVGSLLVAVSLTMKNVWRLRWINLVGALFFTAYGLLLRAWPVFGVNAFITVIDVWYIVQMATDRDAFSALDVTHGDRQFLGRFVAFHQADIARFFPAFALARVPPDARYVFVLRNLMPVGLFVFEPCADGEEVEVLLDYVIPAYRDFENGAFLFSTQEVLRHAPCRAMVARTTHPDHARYLERMGFRRDASGVYRRAVTPASAP